MGTKPFDQWRKIRLNGSPLGERTQWPAHFPGPVRRPRAGGILYQQRPARDPTNWVRPGLREATPWVLGCDLGRVGLQTVDEVSAARGYQSRSEDPDHILAANATGDCGLSSQATRGFPRTPLCLQDAQRHQNWISLLGYCGGREGRTMELSRNGLAQRKPRLGETLNPVPNGPCHPPSLSFLLSSFAYARPQKANRRWMEDRLNHFPSLIT